MANIVRLMQSQYHVVPPTDWLEACVDWIHQESEGRQLCDQELTNHVYEQWLCSNLKDIGARCFPAELLNCDKYVLQGQYAVQVDSVRDVSSSYYSQLKTLKGQDNPNLDVTATQHTQKPWEAKGSRMLMLTLTDGEIEVKGMEYQTIPAFNVPIHSGSKILLKGSILCRLGVLFLKSENVTLLGGEVDELVEANTDENVLTGALEENVERGKGPPIQEFKKFKSDRKKPKSSFTSNTKSTQSSQQQYKPIVIKPEPQSQWPPNGGGGDSGMKDDFEDEFLDNIDTKQLDELEMRATQQDNNMAWEEEDVDYDVLMEQMDYQDNNDHHSNNDVPNNRVPDNHGNTNNAAAGNHGNTHSWRPSNSGIKRKHSGSDSDANTSTWNKDSAVHNANANSFNRSAQNANTFNTSSVSTSQSIQNRAMSQNNNFGGPRANFSGPGGNFSGPNRFQNSPSCYNGNSRSFLSNSNNSGYKSNTNRQTNFTNQQSNQTRTNSNTMYSNSIANNVQNNTNIYTPKRTQNNNSSSSNASQNLQGALKSESLTPDAKPATKQGTLRGFLKAKSESHEAQANVQPKQVFGQGMRLKEEVPSQSVDDSNKNTVNTLSAVLSAPGMKTTWNIQTNIHVTALLSKLEHNSGRCWTLTVKLTDGTTEMDCDLADELLASLIGFTATECTEMRKKAKQHKQMRTVLSQGIMKCQTKLSEINCPMEIHTSSELQRPVVTQILQP